MVTSRREISKSVVKYEIGFGEVPGKCEGTAWPFSPSRLFEYIAKYGPDRAAYDAASFLRSKKWSLSVSLDAEGAYAVRAPELGIDVPAVQTAVERTIPAVDKASAALVLVRGRGLRGTKGSADLVAEIGAQAGRRTE